MLTLQKRKKVDQMFYNDPEKGQQVLQRVRKSNEVARKSSNKETRRQQIKIVPEQ